MQPYLTSFCLLNTSMFSSEIFRRCTVTNAAKLAVYDDINIRVKKYHTVVTIRAYKINVSIYF